MKRVRIGNGCGFWGDNLDAPVRLAEAGRLDYLTLEYLAELTMSILALLQAARPDGRVRHRLPRRPRPPRPGADRPSRT